MYKIIFTASSSFGQLVENLKIKGFEFVKKPTNLPESKLIAALRDADGYILGGTEEATRKVIESAKNLKVIAFCGAGYEQFIDVKAATERGIVVTNTPGVNAQTVAEFTVGLLLNAVKQIIPMNEKAKKGIWDKKQVWNVRNQTLGIIGAGNIGSRVAIIMKHGFGMNILYVSRSQKPDFEKSVGAKKVSLEELLSQSDVVSLHTPLNNETEGMIGEKELGLMKPTSVLINVARAKIVDGHALFEALKHNKLAAAAFDVYYEEPLPKPENDPYKLLTLANDKFILTPHNGANSHEAYEAMTNMAVESIIDVFEGRKPKHQVN